MAEIIKTTKASKKEALVADSARSVGRRKTASARVKLSLGKGEVVVNGKKLAEYFPVKLWQQKVLAPLVLIGREKDFDFSVKVAGGGSHGQAEAVCPGISRALVKWEATLKPALKAAGFMTRDPRAKERKKAGLYKARRAHQWRKR